MARVLDPPFAGKGYDYGGPYSFANFDMAGSVVVKITSERPLRDTVIRPASAQVRVDAGTQVKSIRFRGVKAVPEAQLRDQLRTRDRGRYHWLRSGLAVAPFVGAQGQLYQDLAALLGGHRERLDRVRRHLEVEQAERRMAALRSIADHLIGLAARYVATRPVPARG